MTDQDRLLALGAPHYIAWFEELKGKKVSELVGLYRQKEETAFKTAEIVVLADLISALRAKQEANNVRKEKLK